MFDSRLAGKIIIITAVVLNMIYISCLYGGVGIMIIFMEFISDGGLNDKQWIFGLSFFVLSALVVILSIIYFIRPKRYLLFIVLLISLPIYVIAGESLLEKGRIKYTVSRFMFSNERQTSKDAYDQLLSLDKRKRKLAVGEIIMVLSKIKDPKKKLETVQLLEEIAQYSGKDFDTRIGEIFQASRSKDLNDLHNAAFLALSKNSPYVMDIAGAKFVSSEQFPVIEFSAPENHPVFKGNFKVLLDGERWWSIKFGSPAVNDPCGAAGWNRFKKLITEKLAKGKRISFERLSIVQQEPEIFSGAVRTEEDWLWHLTRPYSKGLWDGWCAYEKRQRGIDYIRENIKFEQPTDKYYVIVKSVKQGSPFELAGIRSGDKVLKVGPVPMTYNNKELLPEVILSEQNRDRGAEIIIERDGTPLEIRVKDYLVPSEQF